MVPKASEQQIEFFRRLKDNHRAKRLSFSFCGNHNSFNDQQP